MKIATTLKVIESEKLEWVEGKGTTYRPPLIECKAIGCPHQFFYIAGRQFPTLCYDCAKEYRADYLAGRV